MDLITLDTFRLDCILGVLPREQVTPQPLLITIRLELPLDVAGDDDDLSATVNYANVMEEASFLFEAGHFRLLETMAITLSRWLLSDPVPVEGRAAVSAVELTLRKPEVLGGRAVPGIVTRRERAWYVPVHANPAPGVYVEHLQQNDRVSTDRVIVQGDWAVPAGAVARLCAGVATVDDDAMSVGDRVSSGTISSEEPSVWLVVHRR